MKNILLLVSLVLMGSSSFASQDRFSPDFMSGQINSYRDNCSTDLCHYYLDWSVRGQSSVVVLEVRGGPEDGAVKLLGCSNSQGSSEIPWIRRDGAQYIFHLYNSNRCTRDVFYYENPVDSVVIQEEAPNMGPSRITARRIQCYSDLCEYDIAWNVRGGSSVVTLVDPSTGAEKLYGCAGRTGSQVANWIRRDGTRYEFRVYDSNRCTADVGRFQRHAHSVTVVAR